MEKRFPALVASHGVAIGPVRRLARHALTVDNRHIGPHEVEAEAARYRDCVRRCTGELRRLVDDAGQGERGDILKTHIAILEDPYLEQLTMEYVSRNENVQRALMLATEDICEHFMRLEDGLMRERVSDFREESMRILRCLQGAGPGDPPMLGSPAVVIALDLPAGFAAQMDKGKILGFATEEGGRTSHTAILARNMDIPAVVGAAGLFLEAQEGELAIVDGLAGQVILRPEAGTLAEAREKQAGYQRQRQGLLALEKLPAETRDGERVSLMANIGFESECAVALEKGAEGVGLLRTEYLYMESLDFPGEDAQLAAYRAIVRHMAPHPVVIRTLDIGGDKGLRYHQFPKEANPALGCRAVRFSLDHSNYFKTQLLAILRASAFGAVRIMFPMLASVEELAECRFLLEQCKEELRRRGEGFNENIELGMMVETPAAVLLAESFAQHVDFFSIGTNDLTQYLLAADRGNERLQRLYSHYHPAVLAAISQVAKAGARAGKRVAVCGEMAASGAAVVLLMGMGLTEFSMSPVSLPWVKKAVRGADMPSARQLAGEALALQSTAQVLEHLERHFDAADM